MLPRHKNTVRWLLLSVEINSSFNLKWSSLRAGSTLMCYSCQCCILNPHGNQECNEQEEAEFRQPNGREARPEKSVI